MTTNDLKPVVLLIDDSADVHRLLAARLRHEPIELHSASTGSEGLERALALSPSAILLDLDMPTMDGFAVLRALKDNPATAQTPVLVLSGMAESGEKVSAFELGAVDYVTKPFDFMELRARLRSALRVQQLIKLLAERAELDGLTGLGNRAQFNRRWREEVAEALRFGRPLSLAIMDLDHFKRINDTYGHPAGDDVISTFGRLIQSCVRTIDLVCRYGGEEFVLVMPGTGPAEAGVVADRIRQSLGATVWPRHPEHRVTCSLGICGTSTGRATLTPEAWLEIADKALYQAKHTGRNRAVIVEAPSDGSGGTTLSTPTAPAAPTAKAG